jgi:two-component system response regulator AtoC
MPSSNDNIRILIFALSPAERDYLRNNLADIPATVLCFEKETILFDNLQSMLPNIVIAKTDSWAVAWRFVFAMRTLEMKSALLIASDILSNENFKFQELTNPVQSIPVKSNAWGINQVVKQLIRDAAWEGKSENTPLLIGEASAIKQIRTMLPSLTKATEPVLITGEEGTGKELLARSMVSNQNDVFVKLNCVELAPEMLARFRIADGLQTNGSSAAFHPDVPGNKSLIFLLDKINRLHPKVQSEILLLLEQVSTSSLNYLNFDSSRIRFITTSEAKLEHLVQEGKFRKDLFYRLNVIPINMPALRERREDIPLLIDYFIIEACARSNKSFIVPTGPARESLRFYEWPGNVDELKKIMYRIAVTGDESPVFANYSIPVGRRDALNNLRQELGAGILPDALVIKKHLLEINNFSLKEICEMFVSRTEKKLMQKALQSTNWNRKKAASLLNISYKSMLNKIKNYDII